MRGHPVVPLCLRPRLRNHLRRSVRRDAIARCAETGRRVGVGAHHPADGAVPVSQGSPRRTVMFKTISRRAVIRGAGGIAIGLPFLEAMRPSRALAQVAAPKRLITWFSGNGQMPAYWYPTGTETNFTLNTAHVPLQPYQSKLILFNGVHNDAGKDPVYGGHQGSHAAMISGVPFSHPQSFGTMRGSGPSLDQPVADKIAAATTI